MKLRHVGILFAAFALSLPLAAQMMGPRIPTLSGIWHPVVGSGAAYDRTVVATGANTQMEVTIVGKEDVDGKPAYWMEFAMSDPKMMNGAQMVMKQLMTVDDTGITSTRVIMQPPGQDPMEMDSGMMAGRGGKQTTPVNIADKAELVGTESVTVPAGTFSCQHFRMKDGSGDAWISDKVTPWSLVKYQGKDSTMVLAKVVTDAKDRITGTPKKFDPTEMMRNRMGQGQHP
jgi:hypothetical protein